MIKNVVHFPTAVNAFTCHVSLSLKNLSHLLSLSLSWQGEIDLSSAEKQQSRAQLLATACEVASTEHR